MDSYTFESFVGRRMRDTSIFRRRAETIVNTNNHTEPEVFSYYNPNRHAMDYFCLCARDLQSNEDDYDETATRNIQFF